MIDLENAFHLPRICKGDEWRTAFCCPQGLYKFLIMPLELTNVPLTFQRFVSFFLKKFLERGVEVNLDNILIHTEDATTQ
jgi:hypothetical protein